MKHTSAYPYLRAGSNTVQPGPWRDLHGNEAFPEGVFETWDPNTDLHLMREVSIDSVRLASECHLGSRARLRVGCGWSSRGTNLRARSTDPASIFDFGPAEGFVTRELRMEVVGGLLAGTVHLQTFVVVVASDSRDPLAAGQPGSVLWKESKQLVLEGAGARFPVELVEFPVDTRDAAWMLRLSDDFDWPFLGGARLYINAANEVVGAAISAGDSDRTAPLIRSVIYHDVGRQLLAKALSSEEFRDRYDSNSADAYPEDSLGSALWALMRTIFPKRSATELNSMRISNPGSFETILQQKFQLFGKANG